MISLINKAWRVIGCLACMFICLNVSAHAQEENWAFSIDVGVELRGFSKKPSFDTQFEALQPSFVLDGEMKWQSLDGAHQVFIEPFVRIDGQDKERSHFDLREAYYRYSSGNDWSILIGSTKVYWGVAESTHLVDVINQTDVLEDIDGEDKLGQPMVQLSLEKDWGTLEFYVLPLFRERHYAGTKGRLRLPLLIDEDVARFDGKLDNGNVDFAARYSHYFGDWDIGISAFHGLSRNPRFRKEVYTMKFVPLYDKVTQFGVDMQYTTGAWLWKLEAMYRDTDLDDFRAFVGGFEYSFYQVFGKSWDMGLIGEYQYDDREEGFLISKNMQSIETITPSLFANNDLFYGVRLAFNDTQDSTVLLGVNTDLDDGSSLFVLEANRRIGENWTLGIEGRFFEFLDAENSFAVFENDSFLNINITRHF